MFGDSPVVSVAPVEFELIKFRRVLRVIGWKFLGNAEMCNTLGTIIVKTIARKECNVYYTGRHRINQTFNICANAIVASEYTTQVNYYIQITVKVFFSISIFSNYLFMRTI